MVKSTTQVGQLQSQQKQNNVIKLKKSDSKGLTFFMNKLYEYL